MAGAEARPMGKREHARWRARQLEEPPSDELSEFAAIVQAESAHADGTAIWGMDGAAGAETDIITQIAQAAEWVAWSADEPETEVAQPDEAAENERLALPEDRAAVTRPWWAAASIATGMAVVGCGLATWLILMPEYQAPAPAAPRVAPPSAPTVTMAEPQPTMTVTSPPPPPSTVTATMTSTVAPAPTKVVDIPKTVEPRRPYFSPDYHNVCIDKYGMPQPAFLVGRFNPACFFTP